MATYYVLKGEDGRLRLPPQLDPWPGWDVVEGADGIDELMEVEAAEYVVRDGVLYWEPTDGHEERVAAYEAAEHYDANSVRIAMDADDAICELYEQALAAEQIIAAQDDAICALYEMQLEGGDQA